MLHKYGLLERYWTSARAELSELASLGVATVKRIELQLKFSGSAETLWKIQTALEAAGIEFISADELKGPGVRLRRSGGDKPKEKKRGRK